MDQCVERIIDLGGEVKCDAKKETPVLTDALEWVKYDLQVSKDGLAWLGELVEAAPTTRMRKRTCTGVRPSSSSSRRSA